MPTSRRCKFSRADPSKSHRYGSDSHASPRGWDRPRDSDFLPNEGPATPSRSRHAPRPLDKIALILRQQTQHHLARSLGDGQLRLDRGASSGSSASVRRSPTSRSPGWAGWAAPLREVDPGGGRNRDARIRTTPKRPDRKRSRATEQRHALVDAGLVARHRHRSRRRGRCLRPTPASSRRLGIDGRARILRAGGNGPPRKTVVDEANRRAADTALASSFGPGPLFPEKREKSGVGASGTGRTVVASLPRRRQPYRYGISVWGVPG